MEYFSLGLSVFFLAIISFIDYANAVKIRKLQVPRIVRIERPVVLDCDYILDKSSEDGLVVKWFFNEKQIYQWIPNKKPQGLGILKGRLDLNYSASLDKNSIHRALHIIQLGPDLSGNYTCHVSTFTAEDTKVKRMLVFVPEKNLELRQEHKSTGLSRLTCIAEGVYPQPHMNLYIGNSEINDTIITLDANKDGLFTVKISAEIPSLDIPEEFTCDLHVPEANYTVRKEAIYYPADTGIVHYLSSTFIILTILISVCN